MDDLINGLLEGLFDVIFSVMEVVLDTFVGRLLYFAETGLCKIVGMLDQMFQVFAGITKVSYDVFGKVYQQQAQQDPGAGAQGGAQGGANDDGTYETGFTGDNK